MKGDREKEKIINLNYHFIKEYEWKMFDRIKCSPNNQRFVCLCVCVYVCNVCHYFLTIRLLSFHKIMANRDACETKSKLIILHTDWLTDRKKYHGISMNKINE